MSLTFGFSLYETMLVNCNKGIFALDRHIKRMLDSADFFGIEITDNADEIIKKIRIYTNENNLQNKVVRITLTSGNEPQHLMPQLIFSNRDNLYTPKKITDGYRLMESNIIKSENSNVVKHKTGNYLDNYLELKNCNKIGFDDVIFQNSKGYVTETAKCNIFFVKEKTVYTPHIDCGLLPGITRRWILENYDNCIEGFFEIDDFLNANEVFVSNSVMGLIHIKNIGENAFKAGDISLNLQKKLHLCMENAK